MRRMKEQHGILMMLLMFLLFGFGILMQGSSQTVLAAEAVQVKEIDYEMSRIIIDPKGNDKVYFSDSKKSTWNQVEGTKSDYTSTKDGAVTFTGCFALDISWVTATKDYELNLKGDDNESIVNVVLPARNSKLKVKFDKLSGTLSFTNEEGAAQFMWKKIPGENWYTTSIQQTDESYLNEIEKMRTKGGKIYVKLAQVCGTSASDTGSRPSKEVKVSITKRANAPTIRIDGTKLTVNSKDTQEYIVVTNSNAAEVAQGKGNWKSASKNMKLSEIAPTALYSESNNSPKAVTVAFRTAATEKNGYSKTTFVTVPAQQTKPSGSYYTAETSKDAQLTLNATKQHPMQYTVVAAADVSSFDPITAKWKSVTSTRTVKISAKKYPSNSAIFVRDKFIKQTSTTSFALPSYYEKVVLTYGAKK